MTSRQLFLLGLAVGLVTGGAVEYRILHRAPVVETAQPAVVQHDSSVVLARVPVATVTVPHQLPAGAKPEREIGVAVQPPPLVVHDTVPVPGMTAVVVKLDTVRPPPVHIALTLARLGDGSYRVVASSPDGAILADQSVDVPVGVHAAPEKVLRWSAGPLHGTAVGWGGFVGRDLGPAHVWVAVAQGPKGGQPEGLLGVGWRF